MNDPSPIENQLAGSARSSSVDTSIQLHEADLRMLSDSIPTLCWIGNADGYILWYNQRWHEYCGTTHEDMQGWGWQSVHHPDVLPSVMERWTASIKTGKPFEMTFPLRGADGIFRPFLTRVQPVKDSTGAVRRWFGVNTDISAEKASEDQLRELMDGLPLLVSYIDRDLRYQHVNKAYERWFGTTRQELLGKTVRDILGDEAFELRRGRIEAALRGEPQAFQAPTPRADGEIRETEVQYQPRRDADGQVTGFIVVVADVTERKHAEAALGEQAGHLRTLNEVGAAVAAELDVHRVVQLVTDAGVELTRAKFGAFFYNVIDEAGEALLLYTLSGADRSEFERFGHPRATDVFAPTFKGEGVVRSDDITKDPRYGKNAPNRGMPVGHLPVRSYLAVPVISRSGEVIGGLFFGHPDAGVFTDASEQLMLGLAGQAAVSIDNARLFEAAQRANQSLEQRVQERSRELEEAHEALRQSQKMEAIGQLTGGIAHDFNNLLTVIRGSADLLQRDDLSEDKRKRYVDAISDTADRAAKLTGQLLAFARRQALKPELFNVSATLSEIADMLRTMLGSRVELLLENNCTDCFVEADLGQFETALVNLAVNARDAMDGEGTLTIAVDSIEDVRGQGLARIRVSDTGTGIDTDNIDRIFEPFYTTKEVGKGTGLGLSQVYGFVKQSDGEISVQSELGHGTTFELTMPRAEPSIVSGEVPDAAATQPAGGGRVLIVEDNPEVGEFACQLLSDLGFDAVLEQSANAAISRLEQEAARFDLIFTDVVMPGMDGVSFGRLVRDRWSHLPVVLTSGYSHVLAQDTQHGFPLVQKPYSAEAVSKALSEARQPQPR